MALRSFTGTRWTPFIIVALLLIFGAVNTAAQGGQASLTIINFVGAEMFLTLDGQVYRVAGVDTAPDGGRLSLNLPPGRHIFSGHIPGGPGQNGSVDLAAGQMAVLGARLDKSGPVTSPAGIVLEPPQDELVFFEASLTPPTLPTQPARTPLEPLPAGQGALVLVNYIGEGLHVDIGGIVYTVPAEQRRQINFSPGQVSYSASAGRSGLNGTALVTAAGYTGLGFSREVPSDEPDYKVGKPVPTPAPLAMSVFPVPVSDEPTLELPAPAEPASPAPAALSAAAPPGQSKLTVINYIGQTITFTIDNRAYPIPGNDELTLTLPSGEYTFTASIPKAAGNSSLALQAGRGIKLSVSLNGGGDQVLLYLE